jgi:hypothetical protein
MKHPISVAELLELHHLGELYVKWATNPVAMSEEDVEELQEISDRYSINGTSALFSFQKKWQQEFGLTAANTFSIHEVAKEVLAVAEAQKEIRYEEKLITNSVEDTGVLELPEFGGEAPKEFRQAHETMQEVLREEERLMQEEDDLYEEYEKPTGAEMDEALREQLHEDNEVDREAEAQYRADQLRDALLENQLETEREIEILKQISNVDELTPTENARLDELVTKKVSAMNSGTHRIPTGVLAQAVGGSEKGSK